MKRGVRLGMVVMAAGLTAGSARAQTVDRLWADNCVACHAVKAEGRTAKSLLRDELFGQDRDRAFFDAVKNGVKAEDGSEVQGHVFADSMTDPQIWGVINYLREIQARERRERLGSPKAEGGVYTSQRYKFKIETVIERGVDVPWAVAFLPDGKMLLTERAGKLRTHSTGKAGGELSEAVFKTPEVRNRGQGGLMDVAVHPRYEGNGWIYLSYSDPAGGSGGGRNGMTKIVRGRIEDGQWKDEQTIFEAKKEHYLPTDIHFGCHIVFQPSPTTEQDGRYYVYFGIGERGMMDMAQDLKRPNGKVHRLWDDGRVPDDNPFKGREDVYESIWSFGHRNPQGLSFDLEGQLWDTEHGPRGGDEFNHVEKARNYGWPVVSYGINYDGRPFRTPWPEGKYAEGSEAIVMPVLRWLPSIAASGLDVIHGGKAGEAFPEWNGDMIAGGLAGETVQRLRVKDGRIVEQEEILHGMGRVRDVVCGPDGSIYVVLNGPDKVIRLVPVE